MKLNVYKKKPLFRCWFSSSRFDIGQCDFHAVWLCDWCVYVVSGDLFVDFRLSCQMRWNRSCFCMSIFFSLPADKNHFQRLYLSTRSDYRLWKCFALENPTLNTYTQQYLKKNRVFKSTLEKSHEQNDNRGKVCVSQVDCKLSTVQESVNSLQQKKKYLLCANLIRTWS